MGEVDPGRWHQCKRIAVPAAPRCVQAREGMRVAARARRRDDRISSALLRCIEPLLALSGHIAATRACPLPDRSGHAASVPACRSDVDDPKPTWAGLKSRTAQQDWSDLVVQAPQLYIQEKVHPKVIIDDLIRRSKQSAAEKDDAPDLFADFNGLDDPEARLEFYQHDQHWSNRMILGDSLLVMASLAEREHLRGQVQCIYIDPPYGIRFNSNWQVSTLSRDVKDGKREDISREPEQVKAFRDTWKYNVHSYLAYLRDRLSVAHALLTDSGSIFVQIGDENVHLVRGLLARIIHGGVDFLEVSGD